MEEDETRGSGEEEESERGGVGKLNEVCCRAGVLG